MDQLEDHILELTDAAIEKILEVRATETDPESFALWINVSGEQAGVFTYAMELGPLLGIDDADIVERMSGRRVHVASGRTYHVTFNPLPQGCFLHGHGHHKGGKTEVIDTFSG